MVEGTVMNCLVNWRRAKNRLRLCRKVWVWKGWLNLY